MAVEKPRESQAFAGSQVGANLHRATLLEGSTVRNSNGAILGTAYDLVLTPDLNHVSYVVVMNNRGFHAVPWSAVRTGADGNIVVPVSERQFAEDPGFRQWPAQGNPRWLQRPGEQPEGAEPNAATANAQNIQDRRFSRLDGLAVRGQENRKVGTIRDLVVSTDTGEAAYAIVSTGGFLGLGRQFAAIPMDAVSLDAQRQVARVDADRQTLKRYAFSPKAFPDLSDPLYAQQLNQAYGVEGAGTVLGYVPSE
jgi:sporulation protein YlmC with PRC-barrel domain